MKSTISMYIVWSGLIVAFSPLIAAVSGTAASTIFALAGSEGEYVEAFGILAWLTLVTLPFGGVIFLVGLMLLALDKTKAIPKK